MLRNIPLCVILITFLLVGCLYAIQVPAWQAPDEPAHYNYVRQLAHGRLPIMSAGDYDQAYLDEIRGAKFAPPYTITDIEYEDWQPPLYYLLLTPVFWLAKGNLLALRLVSLLIGAVVVVLADGIARQLFPEQKWIAWSTAVFVAFLPQHLSMMASVNNDSLAELLIAAILLVVLAGQAGKWRLETRRGLISLGILLGLGFLTKATVYLMLPVIVLALVWRYRGDRGQLFQSGVMVFAPAFLVGALWWGRNLVVYGRFDALGKIAHDAVVVGQPRTAEWVANYGLSGTVQRFLQTTFNSFWGQFGWMAVPMPAWVYMPLFLLSLAAISGLILRRFTTTKKTADLAGNYQFIILFATFLLTVAVHIGYNLTFVQHQGRYLFPALIPIGLGVTLGLETWLIIGQRLIRQDNHVVLNLLPFCLGLGLASLDLIALYKFILPELMI
jgi:4-amino-4-deoxy-L-arabinose transferase-like glycosyltransferase